MKTYIQNQPATKWSQYCIADEDWSKIFLLPYLISRETYLQTFQFKILHRIFACNYWLSIVKVSESSKCHFCPEIDTIGHYFYTCPRVSILWKQSSKCWYRTTGNLCPELSEKLRVCSRYMLYCKLD